MIWVGLFLVVGVELFDLVARVVSFCFVFR